MNACLRAACILLVVYTHHVTSKSHDVRIYARVVLPTKPTIEVHKAHKGLNLCDVLQCLVMEKFSSELRFEPRTPRTEHSVPFNV